MHVLDINFDRGVKMMGFLYYFVQNEYANMSIASKTVVYFNVKLLLKSFSY